MVVPTKLKPRFFKSLLMVSESGVDAGISANDRQRFCTGWPSTKFQM